MSMHGRRSIATRGSWSSACIPQSSPSKDVRNLVLGPGSDGEPVEFRVRLDGEPPGRHQGVDVDTSGNGTVTHERLYQLIRQSGEVREHTFEIEFLGPGVAAYAFTFG